MRAVRRHGRWPGPSPLATRLRIGRGRGLAADNLELRLVEACFRPILVLSAKKTDKFSKGTLKLSLNRKGTLEVPNNNCFSLEYLETSPMHKPKSVLKVVTRIKEPADDDDSKPRIVELTLPKLEAHFTSPLNTASQRLGISLTALKWCVSTFAWNHFHVR